MNDPVFAEDLSQTGNGVVQVSLFDESVLPHFVHKALAFYEITTLFDEDREHF